MILPCPRASMSGANARNEKRAPQIDRHRFVPCFKGKFFRRRQRADACVVDQNVDVTELRKNLTRPLPQPIQRR